MSSVLLDLKDVASHSVRVVEVDVLPRDADHLWKLGQAFLAHYQDSALKEFEHLIEEGNILRL